MELELGTTAKDIVTGFKGVLTGKASYLTGCDQYLVQPKLKEGSTLEEPRWYDVNRLEVVGDEKIVLDTQIDKGADIAAPIK